jgi:hypothetical protein
MEKLEDQYKNLYVIKRQLSELKRLDYGHFEYWIGKRFAVKLFTHRIQDSPNPDKDERVTFFEEVDVCVDEMISVEVAGRISLEKDPRFKDYLPIKYGGYNGERMPLSKVCELIKYLHRLNDLTVFL